MQATKEILGRPEGLAAPIEVAPRAATFGLLAIYPDALRLAAASR